MKHLILALILIGCAREPETTKTSSNTGLGNNYCSTGYCYSYLEAICCPRSAQYACNGKCYTYSGGGSCTNYKTTCY